MVLKALTAIDRAILTGLERHLGLTAAISADHGVHLTGSTGLTLLRTESRTAFRATAGLVLEAFLREESLLGSSKNKFLAAIPANEGLILIHDTYPP